MQSCSNDEGGDSRRSCASRRCCLYLGSRKFFKAGGAGTAYVISLLVYAGFIVPWCTYDDVENVATDEVRLTSKPSDRYGWHGVNLGGWLLLERWMGPGSAFHGIDESVRSEWELCEAVGMQECESRIERHRDAQMSRRYLAEVKADGFNAVRVPFGYWIVEALPGDKFVGNGTRHLDNVVSWARQEKLKIVLNLHGVPGGQSGQHHTGRANAGWKPHMLRTDHSVKVLGELSRRYCHQVDGIQVVNEPAWEIPAAVLIEYFRKTYDAIRKHGETCTVIFAIFPVERHFDFPSSAFEGMVNVAFDLHFYTMFDPYWLSLSLATLLREVRSAREYDIKTIEDRFGPVVVGEWSIASTSGGSVAPYPASRDKYRMRSPWQVEKFMGCTQLHMIGSATVGGFAWTYKTHFHGCGWGVDNCIDEGQFTSSWRTTECEALEVPRSKMDDASILAIVLAIPSVTLVLVRGLRQQWPHTRKRQKLWWCFSTILRLGDLYAPWLLLPLAPPEDMPELSQHKVQGFQDWWRLVFAMAAIRLVVVLCAWCGISAGFGCSFSPAPLAMPPSDWCAAEVTGSASGKGHRSELVWTWGAAILVTLMRLALLYALTMLAGALWTIGHCHWHVAVGITLCNLLLSCCGLLDDCERWARGRSAHRLTSASHIASRLFAFGLVLLFVVFTVLVVLLALAWILPGTRHLVGWAAIHIDAWIRTEARTH